MASHQPEKQTQEENPQGLPIQLKFLLAVIAVGVIAIILKATGVF